LFDSPASLFPQPCHSWSHPVTPSRRHLFALLGLVLPVAAFTASPTLAATSNSLQPKTQTHHTSTTSHKSKSHHSSSVHNASHHAAHQPSHKTAAS
jgi:hypothetical protein